MSPVMRIVFWLLCTIFVLDAKVRILTFHYNRPEFIELQSRLFDRFLVDDFEIIVFNDGPSEAMAASIRDMCLRCNIQCVRYEQEWHLINPLNEYIQEQLRRPGIRLYMPFQSTEIAYIAQHPTVRHCHVIQYAMDTYGYDHDDIVAICDGDAFPIRPLSLKHLLDLYDIVGERKHMWIENLDYLWVVFIAFDPRKLPHPRELKFHIDAIRDQLYDSGAHTYHYLARHPDLKVWKSPCRASSQLAQLSVDQLRVEGFSLPEIAWIKELPLPHCVEFSFDHSILHYGGSSFPGSGHCEKMEYVRKFVDQIMDACKF